MKGQQGYRVGPDGLSYTDKQNAELDDLIVAAFARGAGKQALDYLRSFTTRMVMGPNSTDAELRHREGARWIVGVIEERLAAGLRAREKAKESE